MEGVLRPNPSLPWVWVAEDGAGASDESRNVDGGSEGETFKFGSCPRHQHRISTFRCGRVCSLVILSTSPASFSHRTPLSSA